MWSQAVFYLVEFHEVHDLMSSCEVTQAEQNPQENDLLLLQPTDRHGGEIRCSGSMYCCNFLQRHHITASFFLITKYMIEHGVKRTLNIICYGNAQWLDINDTPFKPPLPQHTHKNLVYSTLYKVVTQ